MKQLTFTNQIPLPLTEVKRNGKNMLGLFMAADAESSLWDQQLESIDL